MGGSGSRAALGLKVYCDAADSDSDNDSAFGSDKDNNL